MTSFIKTALFLVLCIIFTTSLNKNKFRKTTETSVRQIIYFLVQCKNNHLLKNLEKRRCMLFIYLTQFSA